MNETSTTPIKTTEPIRFYFDFISPFAYLGSVGIEELAGRHGCEVEWCPVLLGITVMKIMGLKPLPETPLKGPYLKRDIVRSARFLGIPMNEWALPIAPLPPMRAFVWLKERDPATAKRFAQAVFHARWRLAEDPSSPEGLTRVAHRLGLDPGAIVAANDDPEVKQRLAFLVDEAIGAGVFGAPSFRIGTELFWGSDRLPQIDRWLTTGGW